MQTTMKLSKDTAKRLHKLAGEIASESGERITLEEVVIHLLEQNENRKRKDVIHGVKEDRDAFLSLVDQAFEGGGPEDYKEYDYEDIGRD